MRGAFYFTKFCDLCIIYLLYITVTNSSNANIANLLTEKQFLTRLIPKWAKNEKYANKQP